MRTRGTGFFFLDNNYNISNVLTKHSSEIHGSEWRLAKSAVNGVLILERKKPTQDDLLRAPVYETNDDGTISPPKDAKKKDTNKANNSKSLNKTHFKNYTTKNHPPTYKILTKISI